jgi:hypothetical protein
MKVSGTILFKCITNNQNWNAWFHFTSLSKPFSFVYKKNSHTEKELPLKVISLQVSREEKHQYFYLLHSLSDCLLVNEIVKKAFFC